MLIGAIIATPAQSAEALYFFHTDHLGTPQAMTDENQEVVWQAHYAPFGTTNIVTNQIENNLRFPGQYYDSESELHYNYFRDYDPSIGRYTESDPIGLRGGLNTYGYALQNPLRYNDPFGLEVTMNCRPLDNALGSMGIVHCSVIVWHWEDDGCGNRQRVIDDQYSLTYGGKSPLPPGSNSSTYQSDTNAFNSGNGNYDISVPPGMTQGQFDQAVQNSGNNYTQGPYSPVYGPNSNTAADNIIENAGGNVPDVPGAFGQNNGEAPPSMPTMIP